MQNTGVDLASDVGAPVLVKNSVRSLQRSGHQVSILALQGRSVYWVDDVSQPEIRRKVQTRWTSTKALLWFESGVRRLQRELHLSYYALFDSLRFFEACNKWLLSYDICHEYQGLLSPGAALACSRRNIPYVLTVDADLLFERSIAGKPLGGLQRALAVREANLIYRIADKIICVSEPARQHFINAWGIPSEKLVVIPNGVDVALFAKAVPTQNKREALHLGCGPVIIFVGGFQPWHGLDVLVEAFTRVQAAIPQARLLLVGDGPARPQVERWIQIVEIQSKVVLTGLVPQAEVPDYLALADVAVLPYPRLSKELWFSPLKLYEYMAAGKAIVASRDGQVAEVIKEGQTGMLVEPGDVAALAQALIGLLQQPEVGRRLGENARRQAWTCHSWDEHASRLEEVYRSLLPGHCG